MQGAWMLTGRLFTLPLNAYMSSRNAGTTRMIMNRNEKCGANEPWSGVSASATKGMMLSEAKNGDMIKHASATLMGMTIEPFGIVTIMENSLGGKIIGASLMNVLYGSSLCERNLLT